MDVKDGLRASVTLEGDFSVVEVPGPTIALNETKIDK